MWPPCNCGNHDHNILLMITSYYTILETILFCINSNIIELYVTFPPHRELRDDLQYSVWWEWGGHWLRGTVDPTPEVQPGGDLHWARPWEGDEVILLEDGAKHLQREEPGGGGQYQWDKETRILPPWSPGQGKGGSYIFIIFLSLKIFSTVTRASENKEAKEAKEATLYEWHERVDEEGKAKTLYIYI